MKEDPDRPLDTIIVFGEGPLKPVLLEQETTEKQKLQWEKYRHDPRHTREPDFWLMQQPRYLSQLEKIQFADNLSPDQKANKIKEIRGQWQHTGWFALKKWGRQNALAAGYALYAGMSKEVILTGGKTMPGWVKEILPDYFIRKWPSEAELMKDVILKYYGKLYERRYGKSIKQSIIIENQATNTLENIAYSINRKPELVSGKLRIGLLCARHHLKRVIMIAHRFSVRESEKGRFCSQDLLRKSDCGNDTFEPNSEVETNERLSAESLFQRYLEDPHRLTYWLGYVGLVNSPVVIQNTFNLLKNSAWSPAAQTAFKQVGLDFGRFHNEDFANLMKNDHDKYVSLIDNLKKFTSPDFRNIRQ